MAKRYRLIISIGFSFLIFFVPLKNADAICSVVANNTSCPADKAKQTIDFNFKTGSSDNPFNSIDPQCTHPVAASGTPMSVCCDSAMEANSMDSVRAPLCLASQELGNGNSVCWGCGGYFYCSGGSFVLGGSEPELEAHRNEGFYRLSDAEIAAIRSRGNTFVYNGLQYQLPGDASIAVCGSNVKACLSPDFNSCINLATTQNAPQSNTYPKPTPPPPKVYNAAKLIQARLLKARAGPPMKLETRINTITAGQPVALQSLPLKFLGAFGGGSIVNSITKNYFAKIRYADNSHMMSNLIPFSQKFELFSSRYMADIKQQAQLSMPYEDGKLEQNLLPWDTGWRFCVPDGLITRWDGSKADNTVLRGLTKSLKYIGQNNPLDPWYWYKAIVFTQWGASMQTPASSISTNYNTPAADLVPVKATGTGNDVFFDTKGQEPLLDALLPKCSDVGNGAKYYQTKTTAAGQAVTSGSGSDSSDTGGGSVFSLAIDFLSSVWQPRLTPCENNDKNKDGCSNAGPKAIPGDIAIGQGALVSHTQGYVASDIQNSGAPADAVNNLLREGGSHPKGKYPGGFFNHFFDTKIISQVRKFYNAQAEQKQTINSGSGDSSGGNEALRQSYPSDIRSVIDTDQCAQKQLMDIRLSSRNNVICPQIDNKEPYDATPDRPIAVWPGAPNPLPSTFNFTGDLNKAITDATNGQIPACVLEAVKYIETGNQTNFSGQCKINACSAAGPFQITVGVDANGNSHCPGCGESWKDGSRTCPDGWPGSWPNPPDNKPEDSPCNMNAAADRAVQMLQQKAEYRCETLDNRDPTQQKDAIITAGDSYFGSSEEIPRLGGCTYGEFVYQHCDDSYKCETPSVDLGTKWAQCQEQRS